MIAFGAESLFFNCLHYRGSSNAVVESFFATLKKEEVQREHYLTHEQAKTRLLFYIEVFYNRKRRHSALGYQSPHDYEQSLLN